VGINMDSLMDDEGPYLGLGATLFWAAWGYRHDQEKLKANLQFLADNGFNHFRALGVVGCVDDPNYHHPYWSGREIEAAWPDYDEVIAGVTDLAYDQYGLRVQWTLIGDGQCTVPSTDEKWDLIDRFLSMSVGREDKIVHFELANEFWQNGFGGAEGLAELRQMTKYMRDETDILVAASAPQSADCESMLAVNDGCISDIATAHYARNTSLPEGAWKPVRQPWEHLFCQLPTGSNNEPIGPGSSGPSEHSPIRLVSGAIVSYLASHALHVFHSNAGVLGHEDLWDMSGATSFAKLHDILPADLSSWSPVNAQSTNAPFQVVAGDTSGGLHADTVWPDVNEPASGVVRAFGALQGDAFIVYPMGILDTVTMIPRKKMTFSVIDPISGITQACHTLDANEEVILSNAEALLLKGVYWCGDAPCSEPPCNVAPTESGCDGCGPGYLCQGGACVCPGPAYQAKDGSCLPSCEALSDSLGWSGHSCCEDSCSGAGQAPNSTWDCAYCCPGADACEEDTPPTYTEHDCLVSPTNDTEICDDEGVNVKDGTAYVLACLGNQGGKVYAAPHTGPAMEIDGTPRCQGWEEKGQNAWDYLNYIAAIVCDGSQDVLELDLSNWAGSKVYVGVHDYPEVGAGQNTTACIAENKNPGSGGTVTPPPPADAEPCSVYTGEISNSIKASAVHVKNNYPEFFNLGGISDLARRIKAYEMMTIVINHLRNKGVNAFRCVANPGKPQSDPFFFCSDALVVGPPGCGTTVDIYQDWEGTAKPQAYVTEDGDQTGVDTDDLVDLP
jgi:hypothetical protein